MIRAMVAATCGLGLRGREWLYRQGIMETVELPARVVSVGNLTAGGSGKTPLVSFLAGRALASGISTWILSRGYGRRERAPRLVLPGESPPPAEAIGDEPLLLKRRHLQAGLLVHADRGRVAARAWDRIGCRLVLLDDGFQHWRIRRDVDLVAIDLTGPALPALWPQGFARESIAALARADALIFTRANEVSEAEAATKVETVDKVLHQLGNAALVSCPWRRTKRSATYELPFFLVSHQPGELRTSAGESLRPVSLAGRRVVAASGVANPESFRRTLEALGATVVREFRFRDHHWLSAGEAAAVSAACAREKDVLLVITEKDAARWQGRLLEPHAFLTVELTFSGNARLGGRISGAAELEKIVFGDMK